MNRIVLHQAILAAVAQHGHDHDAYLSVREAANQVIRRQVVVDRELLQLLRKGLVELHKDEREWNVDLTPRGTDQLFRPSDPTPLPMRQRQPAGG